MRPALPPPCRLQRGGRGRERPGQAAHRIRRQRIAAQLPGISDRRRNSFPVYFTDNDALGSYNIEIHNNFDHHSHSTEAGDCPLDEKKLPVHPWVYNQDFPIPGNSPLYDAHVNIPIPADIDPGDYHFMIRVTDRSGWQQLKAVNIKISDNK